MTGPGGPGRLRPWPCRHRAVRSGMLAMRANRLIRGGPGRCLRTFANQLPSPWSGPGFWEPAGRSGTLQEVDRLRRALLGAVSHDLRTPLASL